MTDEQAPPSEPEREAAEEEDDDDESKDEAEKDEAEETPSELPPRPLHPSYVFLVAVSVLSLIADLATKWWAKSHLEDAVGALRRIEVINGYVALVFARNKGGAWGLLQDESEAVRLPFFLLISVAAIVFIFSLYRRLTPNQTALKWGLPLVLGGALGNLIDRIRYKHVIDFIDVKLTSSYHWPTFNVADIAICVGVALMAIDMFQSRKPTRSRKPKRDGEKRATPAARSEDLAGDRAEGA